MSPDRDSTELRGATTRVTLLSLPSRANYTWLFDAFERLVIAECGAGARVHWAKDFGTNSLANVARWAQLDEWHALRRKLGARTSERLRLVVCLLFVFVARFSCGFEIFLICLFQTLAPDPHDIFVNEFVNCCEVNVCK